MTNIRIQQLDAWRGLAAMVVFFHHIFVNFQEQFSNLKSHFMWLYQAASFVSDLNINAVLLFFIISGFSIHLSAHHLDMGQASNVNTYIYKRLKRLLPLYYFAIGLTLSIGVFIGIKLDSYSLRELIGNLLFLQTPATSRGNWFGPFGGNYSLWSLSFEIFFYACYPALSLLLRYFNNEKPDYLIVGTMCALIFSILGFIFFNLLPNPIALFASHFIIWYAGVLIAELYLKKIKSTSSVVVVAGLYISVTLLSLKIDSAIVSLVSNGLLIALVWMILITRKGNLSNILEFLAKPGIAIFAPLGFCSYAIYLFHYPLIQLFVAKGFDQTTNLIFVPLICVAFAATMEYLLQRPRYLWLKRRYIW